MDSPAVNSPIEPPSESQAGPPSAPRTEPPTATHTEPIAHTIPTYSVKIWEVLGIGVLGLALISLALLEVANQFFIKIQNPEQAESIAQQVVTYQLPGGNQGLKSFKTNTEAFALVGNRRTPPDLLMLVTQSVIKPEVTSATNNLAEELDVTTALVGSWRSPSVPTNTVQKQFCGKIVPVTVRQGRYIMVESPRYPVDMTEYFVSHNHKQFQNSIQLFAIGPAAAKELDGVLAALKCQNDTPSGL
jgi:hypothetical protein